MLPWHSSGSCPSRTLRGRCDSATAFARDRTSCSPRRFSPPKNAHSLTRAERRGILTPPEGARRLLLVLGTAPLLHPYLPLLRRAVDISSTMRVGVYDCLYVALAEREGCERVTADAKLVTALAATYPFIIPLSSLP